MKLLLTSLLLFFFTVSSSSAFELVPHSATYSANIKKGVQIKGKAVRKLKQLDEQRWKYSFSVDSLFADIDESVTFSLNESKQRVVPEKYKFSLSPMIGRTKKRKVYFDWSANTATGKSWKIENIPFNTYDRLSYQLQLLKDINTSKPKLNYEIAHKKKLRPSTFEKVGEEIMQTKLGPSSTTVVKKVRAQDNKRQTSLWISKKYPMLLIKMTQKEPDGEEYEIHLENAVVDGKQASFE